MSETAKKGRQVIYEYLEQIGCPIYEGHYQFKLKKLLIDYAREKSVRWSLTRKKI